MFLPDDKPIIFKLPRNKEYADIYFIHDLHYGSELFNAKKWNNLKAQIIADPNAYVCWVGDLMEDAIPNSKSDIFTQTASPAHQKEWVNETYRKIISRRWLDGVKQEDLAEEFCYLVRQIQNIIYKCEKLIIKYL